jgi:hypothetical protein
LRSPCQYVPSLSVCAVPLSMCSSCQCVQSLAVYQFGNNETRRRKTITQLHALLISIRCHTHNALRYLQSTHPTAHTVEQCHSMRFVTGVTTGGIRSAQGQSKWDLWSTKWVLSVFISEYCCLPLPVPSHHCYILILSHKRLCIM